MMYNRPDISYGHLASQLKEPIDQFLSILHYLLHAQVTKEMSLEEDIDMYGRMAIALDIIEGCQEFAALIPEVRTNLVYARPGAKTRFEVLAVDGRITVVNGQPHAAGKPRFGASSHMARLIVEIGKRDPSIRAGIDFANDPKLAKWLVGYCKTKGWTFSVIDRRNEPEEIKEAKAHPCPGRWPRPSGLLETAFPRSSTRQGL
jgi:predicted fused transcriptional regulator/phosphomethylpyrimidine kinase